MRQPLFILLAYLIAGCGQPEAPPPRQMTDTETLMQTYREIASQGLENLDVTSAHAIVQRLKQTPEGLTPLLALLGDPEADPVAKVLTVISLTPFLEPEMEAELTAMTTSPHETTTRACATHLLGRLESESAQARARELLDDEEHRVRAAAVMVLGARNDPAVIAQLPGFWQDPETTDEDRDQILFMVSEEHVAEHLDLYAPALINYNIEPRARERLAILLGRIGDASVLGLLEQAAADDPSSAVRVMARGAAEAVQAGGELRLSPSQSPPEATDTPGSAPEVPEAP